MSQPEYHDLGKACKDFFGKGYFVNHLKLNVKTKTEDGIETASSATHNLEDQTALLDFEIKGTCPNLGLTTSGKWNTKNFLVSKLDLQDKLAKGLKLALEGHYNVDQGTRIGKLGATYKIEPATFHLGVEGGDEENLQVGGSAVFGYNNFLAGYQFGYDTNEGTIKANNVTLGYVGNNWNFYAAMDNADIIHSVLHRKIGDNWEAAVHAKYTAGDGSGAPPADAAAPAPGAEGEAPAEDGAEVPPPEPDGTIVGFGLKRTINDCTSVKFKVDSTKTFTTSYEMRVACGSVVTVSGQIDPEGTGKLGLGVEFGG